jgi:hypothetical protein
MISILGSMLNLAACWVENKKDVAKAKTLVEVTKREAEAEVLMKRATSPSAEQDWDLTALRTSENSLKDEYLLLLFSIPFLMSFIEPLQPYVREGFIILERDCPDWYKAGLSVMIAASFGVRSFTKIWRK